MRGRRRLSQVGFALALTLLCAGCAPRATPEIASSPAPQSYVESAAAPDPAMMALPTAEATDLGPAVPAPAAPASHQPKTYVVEPGDSVRTIAKQFGVTNETIIWENDLTDPDKVMVGQELTILPFSGLIHDVRPGDTLASVVNAYEAKLSDVVRENQLAEPFVIVVGQRLLVPGGYRALPKPIVVKEEAVAPSVPGQNEVAAAPTARTLPVMGNTPQEQFIASIGEAAIVSHEATGVPASVTIAQAILESSWGSSRLSREANNYFGIKAQTKQGSAGSVTFDVWEVIGGRNVVQRQAFRAYNSAADSFEDHGMFFVENGRYAAAMAARKDSKQFAREIARAGYATDPAYASKLIQLMDRYDLYRFDA